MLASRTVSTRSTRPGRSWSKPRSSSSPRIPKGAKAILKHHGGDREKLHEGAEKTLAVAFEHAKEVQGYAKRWKELTPDFCKPLLTALETVIKGVNTAKTA